MSKHTISFLFNHLSLAMIVLVAVVCLIGWYQLRRSKPEAVVRKILVCILVVQLLHVGLYVLLMWMGFKQSSDGVAFLPSHSQFLLIRAAQSVTSVLAGWIFAFIQLVVLWYVFVRRGRQEVLDGLDVMMLTIGSAAVGWPEAIIFLGLTFLLATLWLIILVIFRKKTMFDRLVISQVILPAILLTLASSKWLLFWTHLDKIRF